MTQDILLDKHQRIATIAFNRPTVKNALTNAMCTGLADIIAQLKDDSSVNVVVLTGKGQDFCSGADLKEMSLEMPPNPNERGELMADKVRKLSWPIFLGLASLPQPILTSVRGYAIGAGAQMMLSADLCIASTTTRFILPQVNLAHSIDHGESYYLPRKVGLAKAMQLTLLGDTLSGSEAEKIGLANWCVEDQELEEKTRQVAEKLASAAPLACREIKALLNNSAKKTLHEQFTAEAEALGRCTSSNDFEEAITAFVQKRKPVFKGE